MLSGDGADELFFGYPRMQDIVRKRRWFKIPYTLRKPLVRLALKVKLTNSWAPYMFKNISEWILHKQIHITRNNLQNIFPEMDFTEELRTLYTEKKVNSKLELLQWLRHVEYYGHMQRVLAKVDRMSMANSMEVRVPYLDRSMIEKSLNYSPSFVGGSFNLKGILKRFMESFYPPALIAEKKQGFSVPIGDWLRSELKDDLIRVIFETSFYGEQYINVTALRSYVNDFLNNIHDEAWGVWHIYAWQKWALNHL